MFTNKMGDLKVIINLKELLFSLYMVNFMKLIHISCNLYRVIKPAIVFLFELLN